MTGQYQRASETVLTALFRDPTLAVELPWREPDEPPPADLAPEFEGLEPSFSLDKDWHLVHYLLCGKVYGGSLPLADAVLGGEPIGEDLGYGPLRVLRPEQVRAVSDALKDRCAQDLLRHWPPWFGARLRLYYIGEYSEIEREDVLTRVHDLRDYFQTAHKSQQGMLMATL